MRWLQRLRAWYRPAPKTPEELEAMRLQHEVNFHHESRKTGGARPPMMEGEADRKRGW